MRTHVRRTLCAGVLTGGFTVLGLALAASPATADDTNGTGGLISGNQSGPQVHLPVTIGGQQVTIGGNGNSQHSSGGSTGGGSSSGGTSSGSTSGTNATGSGNQTGLGAHVPVGVSGNQVSVLGNHNTQSAQTPGAQNAANPATTPFQGTSGQDGTAAGNQTALQVGAPVDVCGNQVTVIGDGNDSAGCSTTPSNGSNAAQSSDGSADGSSDDATTSGQDGLGSGNQSWLGLVVPVDAGGNQVTVIGDGNQDSQSPSSGNGGSTASAPGTTSGEDGTGSGNQTGLAGSLPVDASGNQVTVIGDGNTAAAAGQTPAGGAEGTGSGASAGGTTDGTDATGSGNQTDLGLGTPVTAAGNQVTVIGDGNTSQSTGTTGGTGTGGTGGTGSTTDGSGGTGSGNQTNPDVTAPVTFGGNQVTVLGDGNTRTDTTTTEPVPGEDDTTDPTEDPTSTDPTSTEGDTNGSGSNGAGTGSESTSFGGSQGGPAVAQGSLPSQLAETGAAAGLQQWLLLGLLLVAAGLILCTRRFTALGSVLGRR